MAVNFLYMIDPNTMILGSFFIIALALFLWIFGKFFKENNSVKVILSFTLALLSTWGLNRANIDVSQFVYSIGISEETIYLIAPILFIGFLFLIGLKKDKTTGRRKFSLSRMLIVLGVLLIASSLFGLVYQKEVVLYTGIILLVIGLILAQKSKKKDILNSDPNRVYYQNLGREQKELRRQKEREIRKRAERINEIRNRKEAETEAKRIQDEKWAEQQQRENRIRKEQQEKSEKEYKIQQIKKKAEEQKWANEQIRRAEKQRNKNLREQQKYEEKDRRRVEIENKRELQRQEEKEIRMQQRRQKTIMELKSLYNQKYQEAIRQQNFMTKGIPGSKEKYLRLQRETQRIVDKMNSI